MKLRALFLCTLTLIGLLGVHHAPTQPASAQEGGKDTTVSYAKDVLPFLTKHCASCHANGKKKGGVSLDKFKDNDSVLRDRATWDLIVEMIQTGAISPHRGFPGKMKRHQRDVVD